MSYQQFLQSTASSGFKTPSPSPTSRKPAVVTSSLHKPPAPLSSHPNGPRNVPPVATSSAPFTPPASIRSPTATTATPPVTASSSDPAQPVRKPPSEAQINAALKSCLDQQIAATTYHEKRPFAALLLGPDNTTVLLTHYSISHVQHAEAELARLASIHFSQKYLAACTLVSTWEPCAMCTGTLYWSNIGRLLFAASEEKLNELTGGNNDENMTMSLPSRTVLKAGQKDVEVIGPVAGWEEKVVEESGKWWKEHQSKQQPTGRPRDGSINGSDKPGSLSSQQQGTPTTWTAEDNVLSSIDDEGEYKAELDIDWMK